MASKPVARIVQTHKHTFLLQRLHETKLFYYTEQVVRDDVASWAFDPKSESQLEKAKKEVDNYIKWDKEAKEAIANNPKVQRKVVYPI